MTPYVFRLICLSAAIFWMVNLVLSGVLAALGPRLLAWLSQRSARSAAALVLVGRWLPAGTAWFLVMGACMPSYLRLEKDNPGESVGLLCGMLALLGVAVVVESLWRGVKAIYRTRQFIRGWLPDQAAPVVCVAGVLRQRLLISRPVIAQLSPAQFEAVLHHERAHQESMDNFKRLLLMMTPAPLPFVSLFDRWDEAWLRFAEQRADEVATGGDPARSLDLAEALIRVARAGLNRPNATLAMPLVSGAEELTVRVERLIAGVSSSGPERSHGWAVAWLVLLAVVVGMAAQQPAVMHFVHRAMERLL